MSVQEMTDCKLVTRVSLTTPDGVPYVHKQQTVYKKLSYNCVNTLTAEIVNVLKQRPISFGFVYQDEEMNLDNMFTNVVLQPMQKPVMHDVDQDLQARYYFSQKGSNCEIKVGNLAVLRDKQVVNIDVPIISITHTNMHGNQINSHSFCLPNAGESKGKFNNYCIQSLLCCEGETKLNPHADMALHVSVKPVLYVDKHASHRDVRIAAQSNHKALQHALGIETHGHSRLSVSDNCLQCASRFEVQTDKTIKNCEFISLYLTI